MSTVPQRVRESLYLRSDARCERCGLRQRAGLHVSHRVPRGMGGRIEDWDDYSAWNLLCATCHLGYVERFPNDAANYGWKVPRWDVPSLVAVSTYRGWAYLTPSGGYQWPPVFLGGDWLEFRGYPRVEKERGVPAPPRTP